MSANQLDRVRSISLALPEATERLSHGEPTFFVGKRVFTMFAGNHHNDGHIAIWLPVPEGMQMMLIDAEPAKFYKPPYVGVRGWVGIELAAVDDGELAQHIQTAWRLIAPKKLYKHLP
ncbi:MAG TPA: MmcQ/YjbR family DNA-binding protein [Caldilineaceae bacterium]|nr:MmcQ/YjbR family DNA-binding protein [Caldilineaceae bacterium]